MLTIARDTAVFTMSANHPPAAHAKSGDVVCFQTQDCFGCQITDESQLISGIDFNHINPATGPLYIEGAKPGDLLKVKIERIVLEGNAVMTALPGEGVFAHLLQRESTRIFPIEENTLRFNDQVTLPLRPMVGVIGTAPSGEPISTGTPGAHGGNMDCARIAEDAVLYLPVAVEGALLSMGDLHAAMGDGEVLLCGAEIAGSVEVRVEVLSQAKLPTPFVVHGGIAAAIHSAQTLDEAGNRAAERMHVFLTEHGVSGGDAGMLLSAAGDLRICQVVDPLVTCRMEFPILLLEQLGITLP